MNLKKILHHLNRRNTHLIPKITIAVKIFLILIVITSSFFLTKTILGATQTRTETFDLTDTIKKYKEKEAASDTGNNLESWNYESISDYFMTANKTLAGPLSEKTLAGISDNNSLATWNSGGLIGATNKAIVSLYNPPASGVEYIAQTLNNFIGKPVYAANGYGFDKLKGVLSLWKTLRNVVYSLISVFFIFIGIMIMLRIKISPQAIVTIQSSIPKIISSLILVTFSYAIAGLLIDFSYVVMGLALSLLDIEKTGFTLSRLMSVEMFDFFGNLLPKLIAQELLAGFSIILGIIFGFFGFLSGNIPGMILGAISGISIILIFVFIQVIKLFFGLAKCYINLIIKIIIGPLEIGMGSVPGSKINFSSWINGVIANLAVFPISVVFIVFGISLIEIIAGNPQDSWAPNLLPINPNILKPLLGLVLLSIISKLPNTVPEAIFNLKPSPFTKGTEEDFAKFGQKTFARGTQKAKMGLAGYLEGASTTGRNNIIDRWAARIQTKNKL